MVARVRPSLDPFQTWPPKIYPGMAAIIAHLHASHNLWDAFAKTPPSTAPVRFDIRASLSCGRPRLMGTTGAR